MRLVEDQVADLVCLVVDDKPECRDALTASLKEIGVKQVLSAGGGAAAFNMLRVMGRPVDVVISDIRMPEGNGLQLLQVVRTGHVRKMRPNATFVLVTAYPAAGVIHTAWALDANGLIVKPVTPEKLEAVILKARRNVVPPNIAGHAAVLVPGTRLEAALQSDH